VYPPGVTNYVPYMGALVMADNIEELAPVGEFLGD